MNSLELGDDRQTALMKTTDGRQFRGIVQVNSVLRTQNDIADYLLQVNKGVVVHTGDAMIYDDHKFLLGDGVTDFNGGPLFRTHRMITVTAQLAWSRTTTTIDPVSKLPKSTGATALGTALVCMLATSNISDIFKVATSKFQLITNSHVLVDDKLGSYVVTFVETRHGLQYAEVR